MWKTSGSLEEKKNAHPHTHTQNKTACTSGKKEGAGGLEYMYKGSKWLKESF